MKKANFVLSASMLAMIGIACGAINNNFSKANASWEFNEKSDVIIDDFYHDDEKRLLSENAVDSKFSMVSATLNADNITPDDAIYKYSSEPEKSSGSIRFEIFVDENVDLSHIRFKTRGNPVDKWSENSFGINETFNVEAEQNNVIPNQWCTVDINIGITFSGEKYPDSDVLVTSQVAGFSLYNDSADNTGTVMIRKVAYVDDSGLEKILDDFNREDSKPVNCWWAGSFGNLVRRNVTLNESATYTYNYGVVINKDCAVLNIQGDFTGAKVATVSVDGTVSSYVNWADLKDHNNEALPTSTEDHQQIDIDLAKSNLTEEFAGFSISSTTELNINKLYASDCKEKESEYLYPTLDAENGSWLNDFNITYEGTWNTVYGEAPEQLKAHGINYAVNWHNAEGVKFDGEHMVLPALSEGQDYANFFIGAQDPVVKDYMVISAKAVDGASLDDFRFKSGSNADVIYLKDAKAGYNLNTMPSGSNYEYVDENGFTWYIISTSENPNLLKDKINGELNLYYGHTQGQILIDGIFFADKAEIQYEIEKAGAAETIVDGYHYLGKVKANASLISFDVTAKEDGANLHNLRIEQAGGITAWLKDGALFDPKGNVIEDVTLNQGEKVTITVDLAKSGFDTTKESDYHSHWYQFDETSSKQIEISELTVYTPKHFVKQLIDTPVPVNMNSAYTYITGATVNGTADTLRVNITSETANSGALTGVRIEFKLADGSSKTLWFATWQAEKLFDANGNEFGIDLKEGLNTFDIDLAKSGIDVNNLTDIHIHGGDAYYVDNPTTFELTSVELVKTNGSDFNKVGVVPPADYLAPVVTINTDKNEYKIGETVTISVEASDDISASEELNIEISVTFGTGDTLEEIALDNNTFVVEKEGTYTITVKVSDKAGNLTTETTTIEGIKDEGETSTSGETSSGDTSTSQPSEPTEPTTPNQGLSAGAIAGIVIGSVLGLGVIGVIIYFVIKRKK